MRYAIPPHQVRLTLRRRLVRRFAAPEDSVRMPPDDPVLTDEAMLALLQGATIHHGRDFERFRDAYARHTSGSAIPDLQTLLNEGLVQRAGREMFVPETLRREVMADTSPRLQALRNALSEASNSVVVFTDAVRNDPNLGPAIAKIKSPHDFHGVTCPRPDWVAARLWENSRAEGASIQRLETWLDRWSLLHASGPVEPLIPRHVWAREDRLEFWTLAVDMLCDAATLADWSAMHALFLRAATTLGGAVIAEVRGLPETLVERVDWLDGYPNENLTYQCFAHGDLDGLAGVLFDDLVESDHLGPVEALATKLLDRVAGAPELMSRLSNAIRRRPLLLADLAMHPRLAGVAALLVARAPSRYRPNDDAREVQDEIRGRGEVFQEVLALLLARAKTGASAGVALAELAVLFDDIVQTASVYRSDVHARAQPLLTAMVDAVIGLEAEGLGAIVEALVARLPTVRFPVTKLTPILELLALGVDLGEAQADAVVDYYGLAIGPRSLVPNVAGMGPSACRALWDLASADPQRLVKFNAPIDGRAYLETVRQVEDNEYTVARRAAEALRIHIRVLTRAVQADRDVPKALVASLAEGIKHGTRADWAKGRVAAFSPDLEHSPVEGRDDKPLSHDLAGALNSLPKSDREDLIDALTETDEPTILAQIIARTSADVAAPFTKRISRLKPGDAAAILTLTSAQARVEALLSAGLADVAAEYMAEEEGLQSRGKVPGRGLASFTAQLRLALSQQNWTVLQTMTAPAGLNQLDEASANESLQFYQGLAAYAQPDGASMARAETLFKHLWNSHPHVAAYGVNLMAARASQLLAPDIFVQLKGEPLRKGRALLRDADAIGDGGANNQRVLGQNRALLFLATGSPQAALEALAQIGSDRPDARDAAFRAVAFNRLNDGRQALAVLETAVAQFGTEEILLAARRHIMDGAPFGDVAATVRTDDQVASIRSALTALRALDAHQQAGAVGHARNVEHLVLDQLLQVAGSLILLAPEMARLEMNEEDNINGVVRELLAARVHFLGWGAPDQGRGGRTVKRNAGERDVVLRRDATEIAVVEAIACRANPETHTQRKKLAQHFQKLFAYSPCGLYVHLTYGLIDDPASILPVLKDIAENDAPAGYAFQGLEVAAPTGGAWSFVSRYVHDGDPATAIFIAVDLKQMSLSDAATLADKTLASRASDASSA